MYHQRKHLGALQKYPVMHSMARNPISELDDLPTPPSIYDALEDDEASFLPDDDERETTGRPSTRAERGGLFDPGQWLESQGGLSGDLAAACLAFGRLDARLGIAGEGMRLRLALQEVADLGWLSGARIGVERLSLFIALRVGAGDDAALLAQYAWSVRRLTGQGKLEGNGGWPARLAAFLGFEGDAILDLAETMVGTEALHPITQAAFLFHAWKMAGAERNARDIEGGVTAARLAGEKLGRGALFLPLALGSGTALRGQGSVMARLAAFYRGAEQASLSALMMIDRMADWEQRAQDVLKDCSGRTPGELVRVFARWPMVSAPMAEAHVGASRAAVQRNLDLLTARGVIREITGQGRYRIWTAAL
jgi:HTH DNA binding domain